VPMLVAATPSTARRRATIIVVANPVVTMPRPDSPCTKGCKPLRFYSPSTASLARGLFGRWVVGGAGVNWPGCHGCATEPPGAGAISCAVALVGDLQREAVGGRVATANRVYCLGMDNIIKGQRRSFLEFIVC
jgi:hypothetical protein